MPQAKDPASRLAQARARLVLDRPFLGSLVLQLPLVEAGDWCHSTATDARRLYYSPPYIDSLSNAEVQSVLCHEMLHCALLHLMRRGRRSRKRWDVACDYAVNHLLLAEGMVLPQGALHQPLFANMTAEEIYPCLDEMEDQRPQDLHLYNGAPAEADASEATPQEASIQPDALASTWQARVARALDSARQHGQLSASFARHLSPQLNPRLPWRHLLSRHARQCARDDYSYLRPSTRREGPAIYPRLSTRAIDMVAALDVSGSLSESEISEFLDEVSAIKGALRARITLLACDRELQGDRPQVFEPWEPLRMPPSITGGGGTSFFPVFDWVSRQDHPPNLLIYFTDAKGACPKTAPPYPVLWLVKGRGQLPWGERIQLN